MLSHKPQVPGNAAWSRAAVPGGCLLPPGSLALGVLPASISKPQKSTEHLQALPFSPAENKILLILIPLHPPKKIHYIIIFSRKVVGSLTWWGQRVHSEGTKVSPRRTGQGC